MMATLIVDPYEDVRVREMWPTVDDEGTTEVWDGVTVMSPIAHFDHQDVVSDLLKILPHIVRALGGGSVHSGANVTDRNLDWRRNYRIPDVVVYLATTTAVNHGTHWVGGPDLAVEVISPGENPTAKFDFYEAVNTREVLVIDRDPWAETPYALAAGKLTPVPSGASGLGVTFDLVPGTPRPRVRVLDTASGREWVAMARLV